MVCREDRRQEEEVHSCCRDHQGVQRGGEPARRNGEGRRWRGGVVRMETHKQLVQQVKTACAAAAAAAAGADCARGCSVEGRLHAGDGCSATSWANPVRRHPHRANPLFRHAAGQPVISASAALSCTATSDAPHNKVVHVGCAVPPTISLVRNPSRTCHPTLAFPPAAACGSLPTAATAAAPASSWPRRRRSRRPLHTSIWQGRKGAEVAAGAGGGGARAGAGAVSAPAAGVALRWLSSLPLLAVYSPASTTRYRSAVLMAPRRDKVCRAGRLARRRRERCWVRGFSINWAPRKRQN